MGQYYKAVILTRKTDGFNRTGAKVFAFPGSLKLTEHSWNGNSDLAEVMHEVQLLTAMADTEIRVAWVGDYSRGWCEDEARQWLHKEAYIAAWGTYLDVEPVRGSPAYGKLYAVNDDLEEAVEIWGAWSEKLMEMEHGRWWMCAWPILNAVGNGQGGGDYHGVNEHLAGRWAYHRQRILNEPPKGYRLLPSHLFSNEISEIPAEEVDL